MQQRTGSGQRLARRSPASGSDDGPQFAGAVNSTLTNGDFGDEGSQWWVTEGAVQVNGAEAKLTESPTRHTHLAQGFMVNAGDRVLAFTLANQALQTNGSDGPTDAFEAALLDANTGLPVAGTVALTRSDALLNIQTDRSGQLSERLASGVRKQLNADGTTTYLIDLPATLAGTPVYLSFDLLGFGAAQSHVSLRDIRIVRDPQASCLRQHWPSIR